MAMSRLRRYSLIFLAPALIVLALAAATKAYLVSPLALDRATQRLREAYGAQVEVAGLDVGLNETSLRKLRFFEADAGSDDDPWLVVERFRTDLSPWGLAHGGTRPGEIVLEGASVVLRFDALGHLQTRLPTPPARTGPWPRLLLEDAQLSLRQDGHPDFRLSGVRAVLEVIGGEARLSGAVVDPFWGEWSLEGGIDPIALTGRASLRTGPTRFDTPWLQAVPFIRPTVWQEVQLAGISPVDLALQFDLPARKWGYHIHTHPRQTTIHVRAIDLDVMEAEGPVDIEGGTLTLHNIQGQAAGGELRADAVLHCDGTPKRLNFALSASQLDLSRLPKTWHLPRLLTGNLSGKANLEVVVGKPKTVTSGKGRGVVANARVLGIPRKPINLELSAGPGGFRLLPAAEGSDTPVPFPPPGPE